MADFIFPQSNELQLVAQDKIARLTTDRAGFQIMPMRDQDAWILSWEQRDNYIDLQNIRGLNGEPGKVKKIGGKRYTMEPGVYGEFIPIDERELTVRRQWGNFSAPVNITDLVMEAQDQLLLRRLDRIESIIWTLLSTGTFSVSDADGTVQQTDTFSLLTYSAGVAWGTPATSTPLADFRAVKLLARGHSVSFGGQAVAYANQKTVNAMLLNTNAADLYGRRTQGLGTFNTLSQINGLLTMDDLPGLVAYDEGYLNSAGTFVPFIPDNKVVVVGKRPAGQVVGEYKMVRNANNPGMAPGPYMKVIDHGDEKVPRLIEIHDGHNGGPVIYFPSALVIMSV